MKKVFVVGGSGRVATDLIKDLVATGNEVTAGARHPEKVIKLNHVTAVELNLHDSVEKIAELMKGMNAIYFVAGSRGKDLLQTDAMGAVKTMQAAEKDGIKRYIMLSSLYALQPEMWSKVPSLASIMDYNIAKFFANNYLISNTNLDSTILQPANLTEEPGTGKIQIGEGSATSNPIPDVAQTLADILQHDNTIGHVIMMRSGDTPIEEALDQI